MMQATLRQRPQQRRGESGAALRAESAARGRTPPATRAAANPTSAWSLNVGGPRVQRKAEIGAAPRPDYFAPAFATRCPFAPARSASLLRRQCACGGTCAACRDRDASAIQRTAAKTDAPAVAPPIVSEVLRSPGEPLDEATRAFAEPRFGADFSAVRVHTDAKAAQSAQAVNALAYTVGRDIVFAPMRYTFATAAGRKLLAHELTHVVQQGRSSGAASAQAKLEIAPSDRAEQEADAVAERVAGAGAAHAGAYDHQSPQPVPPGVMQCTPAPPTYGGVTGVRDLAKIRIDAVPDFLASGLTAPRVVNAHINEPAVTHLTWMLYDPSDRMMTGSYSTLPGFPTSTTSPFTLQPSHFSGSGFVEGKHILRCAGLNAQHQPIVYADRDFYVLRTDLTTGTAVATTYGDLTFTEYTKTDANPPANPNYSIDVKLRFLPKTTVACTEVGFIQSMQTIDNEGRSQQNTVNAEQDARKTPLVWSIDRIAGGPTPFYGTRRGAAGAITIPSGKGGFGAGGVTPTAASLIDQPSWNQENNAKFESCVICRSTASAGQVYGCATWGYTATASGRVTLMPRSFRQMPSDQFTEARDAWNTWRATVPAATQPEEAPALRSP
jgi:hypothetical protein